MISQLQPKKRFLELSLASLTIFGNVSMWWSLGMRLGHIDSCEAVSSPWPVVLLPVLLSLYPVLLSLYPVLLSLYPVLLSLYSRVSRLGFREMSLRFRKIVTEKVINTDDRVILMQGYPEGFHYFNHFPRVKRLRNAAIPCTVITMPCNHIINDINLICISLKSEGCRK